LLAQRIEFEDPLTGRRWEFVSRRTLCEAITDLMAVGT